MNIPQGLIQNPPTDIIRNYETDDNSDTDSVAELEYKTWENACAWECRSALVNIPSGLIQNPPTDIIRNYETDDNSDTDSVAELECNTWDDTCAWECRIALLILIQNPATDIMRTYTENYEYLEKFGHGGCVNSSLHPLWICFGQQHCWGEGEIQNNADTPIRGSYPKLMNCHQMQDMDCLPHAVCYDCVCLMPLIRITIPLFSDGDGMVNRTGYDGDYDGSPAGLLGCLPRRLYLLWVMDRMTQHQTKINGPYSDILLRKTMNDSGRRDVWISDTPPATLAVKGFSLALIGRRASVGGSAGLADWPCVLGAVNNPPSGVWIDFIRCTVEDSQSIIAVPVTGSLVSPTLFSCRDANCIYGSSIFCVNCDTDWILPAGYQVLLLVHAAGGTMDADRFSIVNNHAGVTFGVELYVPWDAPEMAIDLSSTGTVPLRNVPDVFGMSGRRC